MELKVGRFLHVAEGVFHDHIPGDRLGIDNIQNL